MGKKKGKGAAAAPAGKPVPTFYVSPHYAADDKAVVKQPKALCTCWRNICEKNSTPARSAATRRATRRATIKC